MLTNIGPNAYSCAGAEAVILHQLKELEKRLSAKVEESTEKVSEPFEHPQGQPLGIFELHVLR